MTRDGKRPASLQERVAALEASLSPRERAVARYLADNPEIAATASALELGQQTRSSNATVVRTVKSLGYDGLNDLKQSLLRGIVDRLNPTSVLANQLDQLATDDTVSHQVFRDSMDLLAQQSQQLEQAAWTTCVDIVDAARSVLCYGVEQAGSVAYYLALQLTRSGKPSRALTDTGITIANGLMTLSEHDAVVVFAPLRYFREVDTVLMRANELGAKVIVITEALALAVEARVDAVIQTPQSTTGLASEVTIPLVLARALALEIASRHRNEALRNHALLNRLRSDAVGGPVDVDHPAHLPDIHRARTGNRTPSP